jgi:hypothetical protein
MKNVKGNSISVNIDTTKEKQKTADVPALCKKAELVITNQEQYNVATDVLKDVKARYKELDTQRKSITQPLDEAKKQVMELFRMPLELLDGAEKKIKGLMIGYTNKKEQEAREEQARLQKLADAEAAKQKKILDEKIARAEASGKKEKVEELEAQKDAVVSIAVPVISSNIDTPTGLSYREKWSAIIVDPNLIPREYLIVNEKALEKIAQATKGSLQIPGVRFEKSKVVVA